MFPFPPFKFFSKKPERQFVTTTEGVPGHFPVVTQEEASRECAELNKKPGWTAWWLPNFFSTGYVVYYYNH